MNPIESFLMVVRAIGLFITVILEVLTFFSALLLVTLPLLFMLLWLYKFMVGESGRLRSELRAFVGLIVAVFVALPLTITHFTLVVPTVERGAANIICAVSVNCDKNPEESE